MPVVFLHARPSKGSHREAGPGKLSENLSDVRHRKVMDRPTAMSRSSDISRSSSSEAESANFSGDSVPSRARQSRIQKLASSHVTRDESSQLSKFERRGSDPSNRSSRPRKNSVQALLLRLKSNQQAYSSGDSTPSSTPGRTRSSGIVEATLGWARVADQRHFSASLSDSEASSPVSLGFPASPGATGLSKTLRLRRTSGTGRRGPSPELPTGLRISSRAELAVQFRHTYPL